LRSELFICSALHDNLTRSLFISVELVTQFLLSSRAVFQLRCHLRLHNDYCRPWCLSSRAIFEGPTLCMVRLRLSGLSSIRHVHSCDLSWETTHKARENLLTGLVIKCMPPKLVWHEGQARSEGWKILASWVNEPMGYCFWIRIGMFLDTDGNVS
jgi:hypothetical protein